MEREKVDTYPSHNAEHDGFSGFNYVSRVGEQKKSLASDFGKSR